MALLLVVVLAHATGRSAGRRLPPRRVLLEAGLLCGGFLVYELGRSWTEGSLAEAQRNAGRIVALERHLGLFFEGTWQRQVIRSDLAVDVFSRVYSFLYLPFILSVLLWLLLVDDESYCIFRMSLGISAGCAIVLIALFPVAPPRLMPALGIVDTHEMVGLEHGFVNEFAAVPSFHVGWTALAGFALFRSLSGVRWRVLAFGPVLTMVLPVIVTGNHYWLDGVVGSALTLGPALLLAVLRARPRAWTPRRHARAATAATLRALAGSAGARFATATLTALLLALLAGHVVAPGFTHYWGYMVAQIAATIAVVLWLSHRFADGGGFSWLTYFVVVGATYLDTLGTAGHMYDRFASYDKIAHFAGTAALAATASDLLRHFYRRGEIGWSGGARVAVAVVAATVLAAGWEAYEFGADLVFATYRHAGALDTIYDLVSDATGALVTAIALWRLDVAAAPSPTAHPKRSRAAST